MAKIDPWSSQDIGDYKNLLAEFGMGSFDEFKEEFSDNRYIRRGIMFGQRDFSKIADAIRKKKRFAMMTGLMPSGKFHFGHKMVADQIIWYQQKGADIFICAADIESYLMRDISFKDAHQIAIEEYLTNYIALGLEPKNLIFWFQSDYRKEYYKLRDMTAKRVTLNELQAIYGEITTGKIISVLTQVTDILHPQLPELGGPRPVVVPVGADQDPHIRLTRDIASRLDAIRGGPHGIMTDEGGRVVQETKLKDVKYEQDFPCIPPSATYHKFMSGLQGGKMSSSDAKSYIALTDNPKEARKKIIQAKTGGRITEGEQKKLGGLPEGCNIYELYLYHLIDNDNELIDIYKKCKSGDILCGNCKKNCADLMEKFLKEHQKKREKAKKLAEKIVSKKL